MQHRVSIAIACAVLALAAADIRAGSVVVDDVALNEGNVTLFLEQTSQYHVDAMRRLITERYRDDYRAIRWEQLETAMTDSGVARLEYRYEVDGQPRIRVYHSLGGKPLGATAQSIFEGPTRPGTPASPGSPVSPDSSLDGESFVLPPEPTYDYAAIDAEDAAFFTDFDAVDVRARILPAGGSRLEPFSVDGADRSFDAEFKALRAIEHDIEAKVVTPGGTIRGMVGGATCSSCRYAMKTLSDAYGIDIRMTQMFGSLPRNQLRALVDTGKARFRGLTLVDTQTGEPVLARDVLAGAREAQVRRSLSPRAMGRVFKGVYWTERSFRLGRPRMPRVSEGEASREASPNPDAADPPPPEC